MIFSWHGEIKIFSSESFPIIHRILSSEDYFCITNVKVVKTIRMVKVKDHIAWLLNIHVLASATKYGHLDCGKSCQTLWHLRYSSTQRIPETLEQCWMLFQFRWRMWTFTAMKECLTSVAVSMTGMCRNFLVMASMPARHHIVFS